MVKGNRQDQEIHQIQESTRQSPQKNRFFKYLLFASITTLIISRLLPFIHWGETPLGYDTGFYLMHINLEDTTRTYSLFLILLKKIGFDPLTILQLTHVLLNLTIAGSLYILQKSISKNSETLIGIVSVFLFSVSIIQFQSYWWMIAQQNVAMSLLILTIALLFTKPLLATIPLLSGILIHIPTFIPFLLAIAIVIVINLIKKIFFKTKLEKNILYLTIIIITVLTIIIITQYDSLSYYIQYYIKEFQFIATNLPSWKIQTAKGSFLDSSLVYYTNIIIIPFAIFGLLKNHYKTTNQKILIPTITIILLALSYFPVIYQNRFAIILDLFLIVIASPQILNLFTFLMQTKIKKTLLTVLVIFMLGQISLISWLQPPQITRAELSELKNINLLAEKEARILATDSIYTPWVYGFSNITTIGPGHMNDSWDLTDWIKFWTGKDYEEKQKLLKEYPHPLYIFIGDRQPEQEFKKFIKTDPSFIQVSQHIWKHMLQDVQSN
jgi:hypothetical protein